MEQYIYRQLLVLLYLISLSHEHFRKRAIQLIDDAVLAPDIAGSHLGSGPKCCDGVITILHYGRGRSRNWYDTFFCPVEVVHALRRL